MSVSHVAFPLASFELATAANRSITCNHPQLITWSLCFVLCVGAVVGALARRAAAVSCGVFVSDCGDLQVLQSSDLPLHAHG